MKNFLFIAFISVVSFHTIAQSLIIPETPKLEVAEDYKNYEELVLRCIDYLFENPVHQNSNKRLECISFLVKWMDGAPNVSVLLNVNLVDIEEAELVIAYMGGYVEYTLLNKDADDLSSTRYAVKKSLLMYERNQDSFKKGKVLKKLLKAKKKQKLDAYIDKFME